MRDLLNHAAKRAPGAEGALAAAAGSSEVVEWVSQQHIGGDQGEAVMQPQQPGGRVRYCFELAAVVCCSAWRVVLYYGW